MAEKETKFSDGSLTRTAFVKILNADLEKNVAETDQSDAWVARGQDDQQRAARRRTKEVRRRLLIDRISSAAKTLERLGQGVEAHARELALQKVAPGTAHDPSPEQRDWNSPVLAAAAAIAAEILPRSPRKPRRSLFMPTGGHSELY